MGEPDAVDDQSLVTPVSQSDLSTSDHKPSNVRAFQSASMSENTTIAYGGDWRRFAQWCEMRGALSLPAAPIMVAQYIAEYADLVNESGEYLYAPSSLTRWIASINKAHNLAGHQSPGLDPEVQTTMSGIRRLRAKPPERARPLLLADLRKVLLAIDFQAYPQGVIGHRDAAILLMGFAGAFRRSELASLIMEDVKLHPEDGLHIRLSRSKTDQEARGQYKALPFGSNPITCPPCMFMRWVKVMYASSSRPELMKLLRSTEIAVHICKEPIAEYSKIDKNSPVFRKMSKGGIITESELTGHAVNLILKKRVAAIGMNLEEYSGHSMRAGFITQSFRSGASPQEIMGQSGHRDSSSLDIYNRETNPLQQNSVTRLGL